MNVEATDQEVLPLCSLCNLPIKRLQRLVLSAAFVRNNGQSAWEFRLSPQDQAVRGIFFNANNGIGAAQTRLRVRD